MILQMTLYIMWLLGEIWLMVHLAQIRMRDPARLGEVGKRKVILVMSVIGWGLGMHAASLLVVVLQNRPMADWYFRGTTGNIVQSAIVWLDRTTFTSTWGWAAALPYRYLLCPGKGLKITVSLGGPGGHGSFVPETMTRRAVQTLVAVMAAGGVFYRHWGAQDSSQVKLGLALKTKPFAFIGAPVYLAALLILAAGIIFTVVQRRLLYRVSDTSLVCTGLLWWLSLFTCLLVVLGYPRFTGMAFSVQFVLFVTWTMLVSSVRPVVGGMYVAVGLGIFVAGILTKHWVAQYLYLVWLFMYTYVGPSGTDVYVKVEAVEESSREQCQRSLVAQDGVGQRLSV